MRRIYESKTFVVALLQVLFVDMAGSHEMRHSTGMSDLQPAPPDRPLARVSQRLRGTLLPNLISTLQVTMRPYSSKSFFPFAIVTNILPC